MDYKSNKDAELQYDTNYPIQLACDRWYYYFMLMCNLDVDHRQIVAMKYVLVNTINNLVSRVNIQLIFAYIQWRVCQNIIHNITVLFTLVFLDASKAFDKINHFKLFRKLLDRKTPIVIVRILLFWYSKQTVCVKWGRCISDYFSISNDI